MSKCIVVNGRIVGPLQIELDAPLFGVEGRVEIQLREIKQPAPQGGDFLEMISQLPPGKLSKEQIDAELREERDGWERHS